MLKKRLFAVVLCVLLTVSIYAQANENEAEYPKAGFFFGAGMSMGIFTSDKLSVYSDFDLIRLNPAKIGVYYELPLGPGNFFAGLEGGYASGSNFGGGGAVDFLPINLNATYAFSIADILYVGPGLKAGVLGLLGHSKYKVMPLLGAGLDLELRYKYFPLGIYVQGGVNAYPTAYNFSILPTVEAGLRFPRGAFGSSGQSSTQSSRSAQPAGTAPASGLAAGQGQATGGQTPGTQPSVSDVAAAVGAAAGAITQALTSTVTNVAVTPGIVTVPQGSTQQFNAQVTGTNNPPQTVTWSVTGGTAGTTISPTGLLTVGPNQAPGALSVTATSTADTTRSGTAAVTVPTPPPTAAPTVTNVAVTPGIVTVPQGGTQQFNAQITGTNNPPQTVTWSISGGSPGTSISPNGLLTIAPNQTPGTLMVTATSTADSSRSGTATVTVLAPSSGTTPTSPPAQVVGPSAGTPPSAGTSPSAQVTPPSAPSSGRRDIMDASKQRLFAEIHFEPNTAVLIESTRSQLDAAARHLQANPNLWVLVRTYTAPFGTAEGRFMVALDRARFCRDYFIRYGIAPGRIVTETLASEKLPENVVIEEWITYRTAELVMLDE